MVANTLGPTSSPTRTNFNGEQSAELCQTIGDAICLLMAGLKRKAALLEFYNLCGGWVSQPAICCRAACRWFLSHLLVLMLDCRGFLAKSRQLDACIPGRLIVAFSLPKCFSVWDALDAEHTCRGISWEVATG